VPDTVVARDSGLCIASVVSGLRGRVEHYPRHLRRVLTSGQRERSALGYVPLPRNVIRAEQVCLEHSSLRETFAGIHNHQISLQRLFYKSAESGYGLGASAAP
jgi:hypothetical protein